MPARNWRHPNPIGHFGATRGVDRRRWCAQQTSTERLANSTRPALWRGRRAGHLHDRQWRAEGGYGAVTATPIVIDDIVYVQDMDSNVLAIDRGSGTIRWRRDYGRPTAGGNGVAVGHGHVYGVSREPSPLAAARREQSSPPTATVAKSSGRRASGSTMRTETAPSCRRPRPRR